MVTYQAVILPWNQDLCGFPSYLHTTSSHLLQATLQLRKRYIRRRESWSLRRSILYRNFRGDHAHLSPPTSSHHSNKQTSQLSTLVGGNTVLGNVAGLATVVTSLGGLVGSKVTFLRDVAALSARVALNSASLAVLGKVVWSSTLVAHGALSTAKLAGSSWGRGRSRVGGTRLVLWALSGDVAKLRAVVALGTLGAVWAVALNVANVSTQIALLRGGGLWFWTSRGLVA